MDTQKRLVLSGRPGAGRDDTAALRVKMRIAARRAAILTVVRFADDFIPAFEKKEGAEKVFRVLFKRFEKHGLSLHPEKTRLVPSRRPEEREDDPAKCPKPEIFDYPDFF